MAVLNSLDAQSLKRAMLVYGGTLQAHSKVIDRLNVYPVPDGDTGTNMALTVGSVIKELDNLDVRLVDQQATGAICQAISYGSLMGARGNSGIILSQVLRSLAEACKNNGGNIDAHQLAEALSTATEAAYSAVMKPVEGTMLTVVRAAAHGAHEASASFASVAGVLQRSRETARLALEETPKLLPVLADAGVVDAGGVGLLLLIDSLLNVADGTPMPAPPADSKLDQPAPPTHGDRQEPREQGEIRDPVARTQLPAESAGDARFEVMYLLEAGEGEVSNLKTSLNDIGESVVVVGSDRLWNCHVHTADIGAAIEFAIQAGRPKNIRVTDLSQQVEEEGWVREGRSPIMGDDGTASRPAAVHFYDQRGDDLSLEGPIVSGHTSKLDVHEMGRPAATEPAWEVGQDVLTSVVAVAAGDGIENIFRSLGVGQLVSGGQSMNPSTAELLAAVDGSPTNDVIVLPNNSNIMPVAKQVVELTQKRVYLLETENIPEGMAALLEFDPSLPGDENALAMRTSVSRVVTGEVTQAVRASNSEAGSISKGDFVALTKSGIQVVSPSLQEAACRLLEKLVKPDHELVTVLEGTTADRGVTREIRAWLAENRGSANAEVHYGGQPLYPYLFCVE